jgi:hypothetical protein
MRDFRAYSSILAFGLGFACAQAPVARAPAAADPSLARLGMEATEPGEAKQVKSETIRYQGRTFTLLILQRPSEHATRQRIGIDEPFDRMMAASGASARAIYRQLLTRARVLKSGKIVPPIEPEYLERLAEFYRLLGNPTSSRYLLFEGDSFAPSDLLGTLEFNYRDLKHPYLVLEQEKGAVLPPDEIRYESVPLHVARGGGPGYTSTRDLRLHGTTVEANLFTAKPSAKGIAASLLWSAAIVDGVLDFPRMAEISQENYWRIREQNRQYILYDDVRPGETWVYPSHVEIRPHEGMVKYFKDMGFAPDERTLRPMREEEHTEASRFALEHRMATFDDQLLRISRDKWVQIPNVLLSQGREGAKIYLHGKVTRNEDDWTLQRMRESFERAESRQEPRGPEPRRESSVIRPRVPSHTSR